MLNCGLLITVLNLFTVVRYVFSIGCSESVYEYGELCTIENYNSSIPIDVQLPSVYDHKNIINLKFIKSILNFSTTDLFNKFPNLKTLDVSNCGVEEVIIKTPTRIKYLNLSNNELEKLIEFTFGPARILSTIDLSYNRIAYIDSRAFSDVAKIDAVDLSHNRIQSLPGNFILICNELNLSFNNITNITFSDNTIITRVNINNNQLLYLHVNQYLENLSITHNMITSLRFFNITNNLTDLDLSFNPLNYSDSSIKKVFSTLTNLKVLVLKSTNLNDKNFSLLTEPSDRLQNFKHLSIANNNLTLNFIEFVDLFRELKTIDISENNWRCVDLFSVLSKLKQINNEVLKPNGAHLSKPDTTINDICCIDGSETSNVYDSQRINDIHFERNGGVYISFRILLYVVTVILIVIVIFVGLFCFIKTRIKSAAASRDDVNQLLNNEIVLFKANSETIYHEYEMVIYSDEVRYNNLQWL